LEKYESYIHFGLTSQDINNTALPLMIKAAVNYEYIPVLKKICTLLNQKADLWKTNVMLSRTHGQPAVPTTFGKEIKVFAYRLEKQLELLENIKYYGKFGGASGNFNAHVCAFPEINWEEFTRQFLNQFDLIHNKYTTQIDNYENISTLFDNLKRINCILIDFCQDIWLYISQEYLKLCINKNEVGSSTMPHKINPINFENAEGNLYFANCMLECLSRKLPISRLQRDLTDSTLVRNIGSIFGHIHLALRNITIGIDKLEINQEAISKDNTYNIVVLMEGIQTILRKYKYTGAYEKCKEFSRKNTKINILDLEEFVYHLDIEESIKQEITQILSVDKYVGYSTK
jgi:adenylosuccinate lyase